MKVVTSIGCFLSQHPPEGSCTLTVSTPSLTAHLAARSTLPTAARSSSRSFRRLDADADSVSERDRPRPVVTGTEAGRDSATCLGGTNVRGGKVEEIVSASYSRRRREERVKTRWRSRRRGRKGMSRSRKRRPTPRRDGLMTGGRDRLAVRNMANGQDGGEKTSKVK